MHRKHIQVIQNENNTSKIVLPINKVVLKIVDVIRLKLKMHVIKIELYVIGMEHFVNKSCENVGPNYVGHDQCT